MVDYWKSYLLINRLSFSGDLVQVSALADRAGLKNVHVHALRHSFAKNLVDAGVGLEKVAQMLGHKNLNTTRIYTTPSQADLQEAAEKIAWED
jgi:integrase/recombinase XerC